MYLCIYKQCDLSGFEEADLSGFEEVDPVPGFECIYVYTNHNKTLVALRRLVLYLVVSVFMYIETTMISQWLCG